MRSERKKTWFRMAVALFPEVADLKRERDVAIELAARLQWVAANSPCTGYMPEDVPPESVAIVRAEVSRRLGWEID
jgi:hypothetical protein